MRGLLLLQTAVQCLDVRAAVQQCGSLLLASAARE